MTEIRDSDHDRPKAGCGSRTESNVHDELGPARATLKVTKPDLLHPKTLRSEPDEVP